MNSFSVDANVVHNDIKLHTKEENLQASQHQFLKSPKNLRKTKQTAATTTKKVADQGEIVGWQQISEEQNANSDFEAIALDTGR